MILGSVWHIIEILLMVIFNRKLNLKFMVNLGNHLKSPVTNYLLDSKLLEFP